MSVKAIFHQRPRNVSASTTAKSRKNTPIKRGSHHIALSFTSIAGWAVLAHPRTPSGNSIAHRPTTAKQTSASGNIHLLGATKYAKNVTTTSVRTAQSLSLTCSVRLIKAETSVARRGILSDMAMFRQKRLLPFVRAVFSSTSPLTTSGILETTRMSQSEFGGTVCAISNRGNSVLRVNSGNVRGPLYHSERCPFLESQNFSPHSSL